MMRIDMVFDVIPGSNRIVPNLDKDHDDFQTQHSKFMLITTRII